MLFVPTIICFVLGQSATSPPFPYVADEAERSPAIHAHELRAERPRRSVMFVAFDLEESALQGSTHFAAHPPRDFAKLKAFLTADMIGRSMADVMQEYVFVLGAESAPELTRLLDEARPESG